MLSPDYIVMHGPESREKCSPSECWPQLKVSGWKCQAVWGAAERSERAEQTQRRLGAGKGLGGSFGAARVAAGWLVTEPAADVVLKPRAVHEQCYTPLYTHVQKLQLSSSAGVIMPYHQTRLWVGC